MLANVGAALADGLTWSYRYLTVTDNCTIYTALICILKPKIFTCIMYTTLLSAGFAADGFVVKESKLKSLRGP